MIENIDYNQEIKKNLSKILQEIEDTKNKKKKLSPSAITKLQESGVCYFCSKHNGVNWESELNTHKGIKKIKEFLKSYKDWGKVVPQQAQVCVTEFGSGYTYITNNNLFNLIKSIGGKVKNCSADSWNPSDIFIIQTKELNSVKTKIENYSENLPSLKEYNDLFDTWLKNRIVIGLSLKKTKKHSKIKPIHSQEIKIPQVQSIELFKDNAQIFSGDIAIKYEKSFDISIRQFGTSLGDLLRSDGLFKDKVRVGKVSIPTILSSYPKELMNLGNIDNEKMKTIFLNRRKYESINVSLAGQIKDFSAFFNFITEDEEMTTKDKIINLSHLKNINKCNTYIQAKYFGNSKNISFDAIINSMKNNEFKLKDFQSESKVFTSFVGEVDYNIIKYDIQEILKKKDKDKQKKYLEKLKLPDDFTTNLNNSFRYEIQKYLWTLNLEIQRSQKGRINLYKPMSGFYFRCFNDLYKKISKITKTYKDNFLQPITSKEMHNLCRNTLEKGGTIKQGNEGWEIVNEIQFMINAMTLMRNMIKKLKSMKYLLAMLENTYPRIKVKKLTEYLANTSFALTPKNPDFYIML